MQQGVLVSERIKMLADTHAHLTEALGLVLTGAESAHPFAAAPGPIFDGPNRALGFHSKRSKRAAMFVEDGTIKVMQVSEAADDPAGDERPESSCAENMLALIAEVDKR